MVKIRLARFGSKKRPFYHITVADSRMPRDGRFIERIGYFNPIARGAEKRLVLDIEKYNYWMSKGAQPTQRISSLVKEIQKSTPSSSEEHQAEQKESV